MSLGGSKSIRLGVVGATFILILSACTGTGSSPAASTAAATPAPTAAAGSPAASTAAASTAACGTVNLAVNPWVGYEANYAVISYLLENELGCKVEKKDLKEEISWQGFANGDVDAILENWGHPDLVKKYIDDQKIAQDAGLTGNEGIIGWYTTRPTPTLTLRS